MPIEHTWTPCPARNSVLSARVWRERTSCSAQAVHSSGPPRRTARPGNETPAAAPPENDGAPVHGTRAARTGREERSAGVQEGALAPFEEDQEGATRLDGGQELSDGQALSAGRALSAAIADLQRRLRQLSRYIDDNLNDLDADTFVRLANLQGQLTSRLGRLMRDRQQVAGDAGDELTAAINDALDEISEEWGLDL